MPVDPGTPRASSLPPGDDPPDRSLDGSGATLSRADAQVPEQEPTYEAGALVALLANLADRTEHLSGLLDTLDKNHQLDSLFAELERTGRGDALATVLPSLMDHTEDLEALTAELVDDPDRMGALLADLVDRTDQVDDLVAELERAIARSPRDASERRSSVPSGEPSGIRSGAVGVCHDPGHQAS